jgi:hypothetical protein
LIIELMSIGSFIHWPPWFIQVPPGNTMTSLSGLRMWKRSGGWMSIVLCWVRPRCSLRLCTRYDSSAMAFS